MIFIIIYQVFLNIWIIGLIDQANIRHYKLLAIVTIGLNTSSVVSFLIGLVSKGIFTDVKSALLCIKILFFVITLIACGIFILYKREVFQDLSEHVEPATFCDCWTEFKHLYMFYVSIVIATITTFSLYPQYLLKIKTTNIGAMTSDVFVYLPACISYAVGTFIAMFYCLRAKIVVITCINTILTYLMMFFCEYQKENKNFPSVMNQYVYLIFVMVIHVTSGLIFNSCFVNIAKEAKSNVKSRLLIFANLLFVISILIGAHFYKIVDFIA
jgi:uncharacterized protein with PQ loop repeat